MAGNAVIQGLKMGIGGGSLTVGLGLTFNKFGQANDFQKESFAHSLRRSSTWTASEDAMLTALVNEQRLNKQIDWLKVAAYLEGRSSNECRMRYTKYLDGRVSTAPWSVDEDLIIVNCHAKYQDQYLSFIKHMGLLPMRTAAQIQQRWNVLERVLSKVSDDPKSIERALVTHNEKEAKKNRQKDLQLQRKKLQVLPDNDSYASASAESALDSTLRAIKSGSIVSDSSSAPFSSSDALDPVLEIEMPEVDGESLKRSLQSTKASQPTRMNSDSSNDLDKLLDDFEADESSESMYTSSTPSTAAYSSPFTDAAATSAASSPGSSSQSSSTPSFSSEASRGCSLSAGKAWADFAACKRPVQQPSAGLGIFLRSPLSKGSTSSSPSSSPLSTTPGPSPTESPTSSANTSPTKPLPGGMPKTKQLSRAVSWLLHGPTTQPAGSAPLPPTPSPAPIKASLLNGFDAAMPKKSYDFMSMSSMRTDFMGERGWIGRLFEKTCSPAAPRPSWGEGTDTLPVWKSSIEPYKCLAKTLLGISEYSWIARNAFTPRWCPWVAWSSYSAARYEQPDTTRRQGWRAFIDLPTRFQMWTPFTRSPLAA
eukprot:Sspe_Gene.73639::Locus_44627_Transcript_2_2_Confidence_0.500_Length_2093::g.73639::m.73639